MEKLRIYLKRLTPDEREKFATKCGTTIGYLRKALSDRKSRLGEKICIEIENDSNGAVKIKYL